MKNVKIKRLLSCLVALTMVLSLFSVIPAFAEETGVLSDDFSSASNTEALWKTVSASSGEAVSGVTAKDGNISLPYGDGNVTYINDTSWSKYTVTEGRKLNKVQWQIDAQTNGDKTARPVLYYNPETKDYVYLIFYKHPNYGWQISYGANGSGRLNNNMLHTGAAYQKTASALQITAEYSFTENVLASVKVSVGFYSATSFADSAYLGTNTATITFTGASGNGDAVTKGGISLDGVKAAVNTFRAGFVSGSSQANTDGIIFSDIKFTFEQTNAEVAAIYKAKYASVLSKNADTVTESDLTDITAAIKEYRSLTAVQQKELEEKYALLLQLKQAVYKDVYGGTFDVKNAVFDDFESYSDTVKPENIWTAFSLSDSSTVTAQPSITSYQGSNRFKSYQGSSVAAVVDDGFWLDRTLSTFDCDIIVPETANSTTGAQYVYSYVDTNARTAIANEYSRNTSQNSIQVRFMFSSKFTRSSGGIQAQLTKSSGWDLDAPLHISTSYIIVDESNIRIATTTSQGELSHTFSFTLTCVDGYSYQQSGFKAGFSTASANGLCYIDNVAFSFKLNAKDYADMFKETHSELLSKSADSILASDYDAVYSALSDYTALSVESQSLLSAEKTLLNAMALKLDSSVTEFMSKYSELLNTPLENIDHSFDEIIDAALADYENLSAMGKLVANKTFLDAVKEKLINLIVPTGENYDPIKIDFEYNYFPFVENSLSKYTESSILEIVEDPTDETGENHALKLVSKSNETIFYVINDDLWPVQGQMTSLKYRVYYEGDINAFARFSFVYDYVDDENYSILNLTGGGAGKTRPFYSVVEEGEGSGKNLATADGVSTAGWIDFSLTFTETNVKVTVYYSGNDNSAIYNIPYRAGSKIGFTSGSFYGASACNTYLDDIEMEFERGDFDTNLDIDDVNVYFSGNTFLNEGETLLLSGEKLGKVVESVSIYRVDDVSGNTPAFVDFGNYEKASVSEAKVTESSEFVFDDSKATNLEIIQKTKVGVKVIVPKGLTSSDGGTGAGVYAVKVTATSGKSKVLLINAPWYNFYTGDEGKIVTPGSELEVIGYNLTPTADVNDIKVALKSVATSEITYFGTDALTVKQDDNHYLKIKIPESFDKGEYELYVHSGLGNELCWSPPIIVTVGASPRDSWSKKIFKVSDFGATGDGDTNDTAAILNALNAAYLNGGGIIEFSEGIYRVDETLPIPANTVLKGLGSGKTTILYTAYKWQYGEAKDLLSIIGNCEISGIQFYSTRSAYFCYTNSVNSIYTRFTDGKYASQPNDNIYFNDVKFRCFWTEGQPSAGGMGFGSCNKLSSSELFLILQNESAGSSKLTIGSKSTNVRVTDLDLFTTLGGGHKGISGDYAYVNGFSNNSWCSIGGFNAYVANIEAEQICLGISSSHGYFTESKMGLTNTNNREVFTTDGGPKATDVKVRFIGNDPDLMEQYTGIRTTDDVTYALIGKTVGENAWSGYALLVTAGQGLGQLRRICTNSIYTNASGDKFYTLKMDNAFMISPNRNSTCTVIDPRDSMVCTNISFYECNAGAIYGAGINWAFENYEFDTAAGPALTNRESVIWYITFNKLTGINANGYVHGEGYGGTAGTYQTGDAGIRLYGNTSPFAYGMMGINVKNCDLGQYRIYLTVAGTANAVADVIIENNVIDGAEAAIEGGSKNINGMLIRNNSFDVTGSYTFTNDLLRSVAAGTYSDKNVQGYEKIIIILNEDMAAGEFLIGDVNADGKVSIKDVTLIKLYILEQVELDDGMLTRADVNNDGSVTNRDANQIRRYLLEGIPFSDVTSSEESSSAGSSSENSSSEEASSAENSSSQVSSSSSENESSAENSSSSATSSDEYFNGRY